MTRRLGASATVLAPSNRSLAVHHEPDRRARSHARRKRALIRLARADDADAVCEIYAPIVRETAISFESVPPTPEEMRSRMAGADRVGSWLVCERAGHVVGYAYTGTHRTRAAYRFTVETSVYVHGGHRRQGVARELYRALLAVSRRQGYQLAVAGIALPNPASIALHEGLGFMPVGVYHRVGFKFGRWHDTSWWQLPLGVFGATPSEPMTIRQVADSPEVRTVLREADVGHD
jgi:phosphinothricin acetyltransferase